jgi:CBS domain-containing protein
MTGTKGGCVNVEDVMTRTVVSVDPLTPLAEIAALLSEHRISGVLVRDDAGALLGVVSEADILLQEGGPSERAGLFEWLFDEWSPTDLAKLNATTAAEAMTSPVRRIAPDRPVAEAARRMLDGNVRRLAVVDGGRLVGIVSRADLVRAFARERLKVGATTA